MLSNEKCANTVVVQEHKMKMYRVKRAAKLHAKQKQIKQVDSKHHKLQHQALLLLVVGAQELSCPDPRSKTLTSALSTTPPLPSSTTMTKTKHSHSNKELERRGGGWEWTNSVTRCWS